MSPPKHETQYQILYLESGLLVKQEQLPKAGASKAMKAFTDTEVTESSVAGCLSAVGERNRDAHACPLPNRD